MARKESITINNILETAFEMARVEGIESVTARRVAARAGCSTQPIFRVYKGMDELWQAVYLKASDFFSDYYELYPRTSNVPFTNLGMAYIAFAREEKNLFQLLFLSTNSWKKGLYETLNGAKGNVLHEINMASAQGCDSPQEMFMRMWIFIHGAASMSLTRDYDLSELETRQFLEKEYQNGLEKLDE